MNVRPWVWVLTGVGALAGLLNGRTVVDAALGGLIWFGIAFVIDWLISRAKGRKVTDPSQSPPSPAVSGTGMGRRCKACNAEVPDSGNFCPSCGASVREPSCPNCMAVVASHDRFCEKCGTPLSGGEATGSKPSAMNHGPSTKRVKAKRTKDAFPRVSKFVQIVFWVLAAVGLFGTYVNLADLLAFNEYWKDMTDTAALDSWVSVDDLINPIAGVYFLLHLVLLFAFMTWQYLAHLRTEGLSGGSRRWSSNWTMWGWFVPLGNWVIPKLVMNEIERVAAAPRQANRTEPSRRNGSTSLVGWVWWLFFVASSIFSCVWSVIPSPAFQRRNFDLSLGQIQRSYVLFALAMGCATISCVSGALFVRKVSGRLSISSLTNPSS